MTEPIPKWKTVPERNELWKREGRIVRIDYVRASEVQVTDIRTGRVREIPREAFLKEWQFERGGR